MKKFILTLTVLSILLILSASAHARNPFGTPGGHTRSEENAPNPVYLKLAAWQQNLNGKLTDLMNKSRESGTLRPFLPLIAIAFLYGIIHAVGPGHGKAVAATFLISRGRKIQDGFYIGNLIALMHGASGICLVLFLRLILRSGVMDPLGEVTQITKITSYSLITLTGLILLCKSLHSWYRNTGVARHNYSGKYDTRPAGSLTMALVIGMIPCPGTVLIMLYAISINMTIPGILLAVSQTLGMAVTISTIGVVVVAGKIKSQNMLDYRRKSLADQIELAGGCLASLGVLTLGALLLRSTM